jgi:preprotein translocase subunit SecF
MNYLIKALLSILVLFASQVYAGAGHNHGHGHDHQPVSKSEAQKIARDSLSQLIQRDAIEKTWSTASLQSAEKKEFGEKMEWVVVFKNEKASNSKEQNLYVFLSLEGQYIAANYTGE